MSENYEKRHPQKTYRVYLKKGDVVNAGCLLEVQEDGVFNLLEVVDDVTIYNDGSNDNVQYDPKLGKWYYEVEND